MKLFLIKVTIFFTLITTAYSQNDKTSNNGSYNYYFYHGRNFGSEANIHPVALIINGGYGIMQASNRDKSPFNVDYLIGFKNLTENLSSPIDRINQYGWKTFITSELLPASFELKSAQYFPNYQQHLIGGGMSYRMMLEWYRYNNYSFPTVYALTTITFYHFLNEIVENNSFRGINIDPIADIYIFDTVSILLFSFDSVSEFFAKTLNLSDWSYQPTYNPFTQTLENNGQNFALKYKLPFYDKLSIFYYFGMHGVLGLSYRTDNGENFSFGAGAMTQKLVKTDIENGNIRSLTATLVWNVGFFYDIDNSLMTSLIISGSRRYKARLNIYPGMINFGRFSPGFFGAIGQNNEIIFGINLRYIPIGLSYQVRN
jgi:hypothetical protein